MMGPRQRITPKLFYPGISIDERIPGEHKLRKIVKVLDFGFVRSEVAGFYGYNGQQSIDPVVLIKLMLLLYMEQVESERQLMEDLKFRLDWMWFCGFDLDDDIPNHSVLSKARALWGVEVFEAMFAQVLGQCIDAGLADGKIIHVDASCIDGNVDKDRIQPVLRLTGRRLYEHLDEQAQVNQPQQQNASENSLQHPSGRFTAKSDPEAGLTRNRGRTVCGYKDHRAVDDAHGIITATVTTDAAINEGYVLQEVLQASQDNTQQKPQTVVADKQYGTAENYRQLKEQDITPCIPHRLNASPSKGKSKFDRAAFQYDSRNDCFVCPAGQRLTPSRRDLVDRHVRYEAGKGVCLQCSLCSQCTDSKTGRCIMRNMDQEYIDWADGCLSPWHRRRLMTRRKTCMEGSFADAANNHRFKRARWRGLMKMQVQNLLVAACQNLRKLLAAVGKGSRGACQAVLACSPAVLKCVLAPAKHGKLAFTAFFLAMTVPLAPILL